MGLWTAIKSVGKNIVRGIVKVVECTLEVCSVVARVTSNVCHNLASTIKRWRSSISPKSEPVPQQIKDYYGQIVQDSARAVKEHFPTGVRASCSQLNAEERVKNVTELVGQAASCLGIKNPPEVELFVPDNPEQTFTSYGSYNFRENKLKLNLPMIVSGEPELLHEQVSTVFHELIHARQHLAIEAFAEGRPVAEFGYTEEYVAVLAENYLNYISPDENYEAYTKQPLEAEAYYFEQQLKPLYD